MIKVTSQTFRDVFKSIEEFAERYRAEIYPDSVVECITLYDTGIKDIEISIQFQQYSDNNYIISNEHLDIDSSDWDNREEILNKAIYERDNKEAIEADKLKAAEDEQTKKEITLYKELHKKYGDHRDLDE